MRILISFCGILFLSSLYGQETFYKLYSGNGFDKGEGIIQLPDSSYVITGSSGSFAENSQAFLLAVDKSGNYNWSKSYGGNESDLGKRVLSIPNNGFFIAGISNSYGAGDFDAFLLKTDIDGNQQWIKNYNIPESWEKINDAVLTADSGVVMVGEIISTTNGNSDIFLIRADKNGDTVWTKKMGTTGEDLANAIIKKNNNFLIGGQWHVTDSSCVKGILFEIDEFGNEIWRTIISDFQGDYIVNDICLGSNKIYACGYNRKPNINYNYFGVFDMNGDLFSQYTEQFNEKTQKVNQIMYNPNNNRVICAYQTINPSTYQDNYDLYYAHFETDLLYWLNEFQSVYNEGLDDVGEIITTLDGGYIGVGHSMCTGLCEFTSNGGSHIYLFKVSSYVVFPFTEEINVLNQLVNTKELKADVGAIYPNPVNDYLNVVFEQPGYLNFELCNLMGNKILEGKLSQKDKIDFKNIPCGVYFLSIENTSWKIIKE